jgi:hypothetical protein
LSIPAERKNFRRSPPTTFICTFRTRLLLKPRKHGSRLCSELNRFQIPGAGALLPGIRLRFDVAALRPDNSEKPLPTKARALDHIGFELKNLEAFCKELEANGVKFDQPYSKTRHRSFASAELTDPWGISIELTEGLKRF